MKKIASLVALLLIAIPTLKSQYFSSISTSTFYDQNSTTNDLHFDDDWDRSDTTIKLTNGEIQVKIPQNTTVTLRTGLMSLSPGDIIFIDHKISNASKSAYVEVYYIDINDVPTLAKTINYSSANMQSTIDTVSVDVSGSYRIGLVFNKTTGNSQQYFSLIGLDVYNPTFLPIGQSSRSISNNDIKDDLSDVIVVFDLTYRKIFEGYLSEFYKVAEKDKIYIIDGNKIIIQ